MTIKQLVLDNKDILQSSSLSELTQWAIDNQMNNRMAFSRYKKALIDIGVNYNEIITENKQLKVDQIKESTQHSTTMYTDYKLGTNKFAVMSQTNLLWHGVDFDKPSSQARGELNAAMKAVWLAGKIRQSLELPGIELNLFVDAEWLLYRDKPKHKAHCLTQNALKYKVDLNMEHTHGKKNPADVFTTVDGYKKWSDNDLSSLVSLIKNI